MIGESPPPLISARAPNDSVNKNAFFFSQLSEKLQLWLDLSRVLVEAYALCSTRPVEPQNGPTEARPTRKVQAAVGG